MPKQQGDCPTFAPTQVHGGMDGVIPDFDTLLLSEEEQEDEDEAPPAPGRGTNPPLDLSVHSAVTEVCAALGTWVEELWTQQADDWNSSSRNCIMFKHICVILIATLLEPRKPTNS